ncbi:META domain-containing protein [Fibrella aquatica]|uniref:META domain-containing protein n=1 Tax=Fibrella aquatica TaxID=3242487 RepID=UPI0035228340
MQQLPLTRLTFLWLSLLIMAGCSQQKEEIIPVADPDLIAGDWVLIEPASEYTVTLRIASTGPLFIEHYGLELTGRSSVNQYFASAAFSQRPSIESGPTGTGSVSGLGATKMAGPPAAMQFEDTYFERLRAVNKVELAGNKRLRLSYGGSSPGVLVYKRQ